MNRTFPEMNDELRELKRLLNERNVKLEKMIADQSKKLQDFNWNLEKLVRELSHLSTTSNASKKPESENVRPPNYDWPSFRNASRYP